MMTPLPMRFLLTLGLLMSLVAVGASFPLGAAYAAPAHAQAKPSAHAVPHAAAKPVVTETPEKLSPKHVPEKPKVSQKSASIAKAAAKPKATEDNVPLAEAVKSSEGQTETVGRIYSVFLAGLVVLVLALLIARRLGLLPASDASGLYGSAGDSSAPWARMRPPNTASLPTPLTPDNPNYFKPSIAHRQKLGGGRELVTLQLAGQWLLLGVTPTQIQFLANLTPPASTALVAPELDDPQLESLFNKYVEPIQAEIRQQTAVRSASATLPSQGVPSNGNGNGSAQSVHRQDVTQDLDLDEFELPDFEDVFDPARPLVPESIRLNGQSKTSAWPVTPVSVLTTPFQAVNGTSKPNQDDVLPVVSSAKTTLQQMAESPGPLPNHPSQAPPDYLV